MAKKKKKYRRIYVASPFLIPGSKIMRKRQWQVACTPIKWPYVSLSLNGSFEKAPVAVRVCAACFFPPQRNCSRSAAAGLGGNKNNSADYRSLLGKLVGHSEKGVYGSAALQKDRRSASQHKADRAVIRFPSDFKSHVDNQGEDCVWFFL
ncbi:hypothetical protein QTP88_008499 [Uroleucon formosanum]